MIAPKLRFSEFKDEWFETTLNNLSNKIGDGLHATPKYDENGEIPFINGNNLINGKIVINESTKLINSDEFKKYNQKFSNNSIFLSINGTIGNIAFYNSESILLGKSVCFIDLSESSNKNLIYYILQSPVLISKFEKELTGTTIKNLSLATVRNTKFLLPNLKEQTKIAEFLSAVDDKISQLSRQLELLNQYKKGVMQKIFSQEIRFKNDNGEDFGKWDYVKLQDISERVTRKNKEHNQNALTISAQLGLITQQEFFSKQIASRDMSNYYLLHKGEFAYNKSYSTGYPMGAIKRLDRYEKGVVSTLYICFALKPSIDSNFFQHYVDSGTLVQELSSVAQEGARNHGLLNISLSDFFSVDLFVPSLPEQKKIAEFLTAIDERIDHTTAQLTHTKQWKKGLLQQMFV